MELYKAADSSEVWSPLTAAHSVRSSMRHVHCALLRVATPSSFVVSRAVG